MPIAPAGSQPEVTFHFTWRSRCCYSTSAIQRTHVVPLLHGSVAPTQSSHSPSRWLMQDAVTTTFGSAYAAVTHDWLRVDCEQHQFEQSSYEQAGASMKLSCRSFTCQQDKRDIVAYRLINGLSIRSCSEDDYVAQMTWIKGDLKDKFAPIYSLCSESDPSRKD